VLTPEGTVALVASDAPGHRAGGIRPGTKLAKLRGRAKRIGGGIWVVRKAKKARASKKGKSRIVYLVRKKRVRTVAIAGPQARGRKGLRQYMSLVPTTGMNARRALAARRTGAPITARNASPLVQQHDPGRFELFCNLGL
jgi:isoaspartyl peptidase/L-asparaginase-like protein (Ntn-hydrolase superfamily)